MAKHVVKRATTADTEPPQYVYGLFQEFIADKKALGRTPETLTAYKTTYEKFSNYFGETADEAGNITYSLFIEWTNALRDEGLKPASINHYLSGVRSFMYWCMDEVRGYIPRFKISLVKAQEEAPKDYTLEEVRLLLKKPDKSEKKFAIWRCWAIASFIIGTGARSKTITEIRMKDIDLKDGKVHYQHTKNKKYQNVNISPQLIKTLTEYINMWRYNAGEEDYLFCSISNKQLSRHSLRSSYTTYTTSRGVNKTNLHGLRHTFAREWYANGGDMVQLSKILGHSTLAMTDHYMNVYSDNAREKFIQYNPLENITRGQGRTNTVKRKG